MKDVGFSTIVHHSQSSTRKRVTLIDRETKKERKISSKMQ